MNAKFFVPYETAKTLVVKYYNEGCEHFYNTFGKITTDPKGCKIAAPTYNEVIDWLESKDIYVSVSIDFNFHKCKMEYNGYITSYEGEWSSEEFTTREEALNAAILKALELI